MAGSGKRFKRAGYDTYKPFIKINDKCMVDYILDAFPEDVGKYIITSENLLKESEKQHLVEKNCTVIYIDPHTDGPAYSIYQAKDHLPLDECFFISYVDIAWEWNWEEIKKNLDHDGIVFTHNGFHPHLIENNYSAFCRVSEDKKLLEIKEKGSFTDNHLEEDLSIGIFYVRSGHNMISAIDRLIANDTRVSNEFFPSLMFNELISDGKTIDILGLDYFIHWGIPEQLNDFIHWKKVTESIEKPPYQNSENQINNIMTMAGLGERMKSISNKPKALIEINGKPMYQFVSDYFPCADTTTIITEAVKKEINVKDDKSFYTLPHQTKSQFETIKSSKDVFKGKENFFLTSCDAYGLFNKKLLEDFIESNNPDAIIFTFSHTLTQEKLSKHHTHVSHDGNLITQVHIKSKTSDEDLGLAGFFWIKNGDTYNSIVEQMNESDYSEEIVADHVLKKYIELGYNVGRFHLDNYIHIGTKNEYLEFKYWMDRKNVFS